MYEDTISWLVDLWRSRSSWCCVHLWGKYCCCWNKHYNPSDVYRYLCSLNQLFLCDFLWLVKQYPSYSCNCFMASDDDLLELRQSKGKYCKILCEMCQFYRDWHVKSDGVHGNCCLYFHYLTVLFYNFFYHLQWNVLCIPSEWP